jgi:addiction module HigA family antidote
MAKKRDIPPVHPGEFLKAEFLDELGLSVAALARAIGVPRTRLNDIVLGRRGVTADTAMRLGRYFGMSAQFWMNLQAHYELETAAELLGDRLLREITPRAAA